MSKIELEAKDAWREKPEQGKEILIQFVQEGEDKSFVRKGSLNERSQYGYDFKGNRINLLTEDVVAWADLDI